ncbi:MAG: CdaR family protein [Desulfitobacteriaceae bacterium]|nr:CdaR family protein [Desulfitobacteriaceae bacterium]
MGVLRNLGHIFKRNLGYKIASVFFGLLFWLWVSYQGIYGSSSEGQPITMQLVTKGLSRDLVVMSKLPSIKVYLRGNTALNVKDLSAYVDLSGGTVGEHNYRVEMDILSTGIEVSKIQPANVSIKLDLVEEKVVPVAVNISGSPGDGFSAGDPIVKPSAVNVRGPSTLLSLLEKATIELSVAGVTETMQINRPVLFRDKAGKPVYGPDPSVDIILASPNNVEVIVPMQPAGLASKKIPLQVTSTGTPAKDRVLRSLSAVPGSIQIWGPAESLQDIEFILIEPVDITDLQEDRAFPVTADMLSLPKGVSVATGTKLTVLAQIGSGLNQKTISEVVIFVKNISTGLDVDPALPSVDVSVQGTSEVLNFLTAEQLQLWIDATGLTAGNYPNCKVYWQLPPGVEIVSVPQVDLNLKPRTT